MARIPRSTQIIFAGSAAAAAGGIGEYGSAAAGTPTYSTTLGTIQSLAAWTAGWNNAVIGGSKFVALEDMNAVEYVHSTQIAYLLQQGIAEYDAGTTYYANNICVNPGTYQLYGSVTNGNIGNALTNATYWQFLCDLSVLTPRLTANLNLYVATTGSDSNNGLTSGTPFLTIQKAINTCYNYHLNGFNITINVANGTYAPASGTAAAYVGVPFVGGQVFLLGNTTTPSNCLLSTTSVDCISVQNGALLTVAGFKLTTTTGGACLKASQAGIIATNGNMEFGSCASFHIFATSTGNIIPGPNYIISGSAASHYAASAFGEIVFSTTPTITVNSTPAFTTFAACSVLGVMNVAGATFSGSATGQRYTVFSNSVISTNGGGANYFPGNSAGSVSGGGIYG